VGAVRLVDARVVEEEPQRTRIEVLLRNTGSAVAFVKKATFQLSASGVLYSPLSRFSQRKVSAVYDVALDPGRVPYEVGIPLAQVVGRDDADMFAFDLAFDESFNVYSVTEALIQVCIVLAINEDDPPVRSKTLLLRRRPEIMERVGYGNPMETGREALGAECSSTRSV
jgi:hypothetical protein